MKNWDKNWFRHMPRDKEIEELMKKMHIATASVSEGWSLYGYEIDYLISQGYIDKEEYEELREKINEMYRCFVWIAAKLDKIFEEILGK